MNSAIVTGDSGIVTGDSEKIPKIGHDESEWPVTLGRNMQALGNERFKVEIERLTGRRMTAKKMGRLVGWRKEKVDC